MRPWFAICILVAVSVAGCTGDGGGNSTVPGDPSASTDPSSQPSTDPSTTSQPAANATGPRTYRNLALSQLDYEDTFQRFQIVGAEGLEVSVEFAMNMGGYANEDNCALFSMYQRHPFGPVSQSLLVVWAFQNAPRFSGSANGEDVVYEYPEDSSAGSPPIAYAETFRYQLGDVPLEIGMGGRSPAYAQSNNLEGANHFRANITANGPFELVPRPSVDVRCGVGAWQAEEGVRAGGQVSEAGSGPSIEMETTDASTMVLLHEPFPGAQHEGGTTEFLGFEAPWGQMSSTAAMGGTLALHWGTYSSPFPQDYWLMADDEWPAVNSFT